MTTTERGPNDDPHDPDIIWPHDYWKRVVNVKCATCGLPLQVHEHRINGAPFYCAVCFVKRVKEEQHRADHQRVA